MNAVREKPRVCFVVPSLNPGGTERQLIYLLDQLRDTHACTVICTRIGGAWASRAREAGATVHELKSWGGWDFRIGSRVRAIFQRERPDIVHTFLFGFDYPVNLAARRAGVPVIISSRRELAAWMKPRHVRAQQRANTLVDCIVANSHAAAKYAEALEGITPGLLRVIHNGIDANTFCGDASQPQTIDLAILEGRRVVGMVANFSAVKDHALFLAAAGVLMDKRNDLHFLLVGDGPLREQISSAVGQRGWEGRFTMTSAPESVAPLLRRMEVVVLTSQREGFPNALLEAMAVGRPVVASAVGGIPEIIEHGVHGMLVPSREPAAFAEAIEQLLNDDALAAKLAENGARRVREAFSVEAMADAYRALYTGLPAKSRTEVRN